MLKKYHKPLSVCILAYYFNAFILTSGMSMPLGFPINSIYFFNLSHASDISLKVLDSFQTYSH
jgi:hypothetical protein